MQSRQDLTIEGFQRRLANGESQLIDWWEICQAQIAVCEPEVQAWEYLSDGVPELDVALSDNALLKGIPVGLKDLIETYDMPTSWGTEGYLRSSGSLVDASLVTLLRQQGALIMGKTVTTELAYFMPSKTRNPHDLLRTPSGSSSGSAAAVAAGMLPLAFGTQTVGRKNHAIPPRKQWILSASTGGPDAGYDSGPYLSAFDRRFSASARAFASR